MTDEQIEAENAEAGGDQAWCSICRQYVHPSEAEDHERSHERLAVKALPSGYVYIRGHGPCNWAQGETLQRAEAYHEASVEFREALARLKRGNE